MTGVDVTWKRDKVSRLGVWRGYLGNHPVGLVMRDAKGYNWEAFNGANAGAILHRDNRGTVDTLAEARQHVRQRTHAMLEWNGKAAK